jgi:hypothetical protein
MRLETPWVIGRTAALVRLRDAPHRHEFSDFVVVAASAIIFPNECNKLA